MTKSQKKVNTDSGADQSGQEIPAKDMSVPTPSRVPKKVAVTKTIEPKKGDVPQNLSIVLPDDTNMLTKERIDIITNTVAKGANPMELKLFLLIAQRTGLDPFMRQIYFVKRFDTATGAQSGTMQVGIDGLRAIAEKSGEYAGSDEAVYEEAKDGKGPLKATVTVHRIVRGQKVSFSASARWSEYFPGEKLGFMWRKMPYNMLAKCAEALALRKAFPMSMSGLYAHEEMSQANKTAVVMHPNEETASVSVPEAPIANSATYNKALTLISREENPETLADYREKIKQVKLYSEDQKAQLIRVIDAKLNPKK